MQDALDLVEEVVDQHLGVLERIEDLTKDLDSVLDGILRSLSARRKPGSMAIPITVVRGSRV